MFSYAFTEKKKCNNLKIQHKGAKVSGVNWEVVKDHTEILFWFSRMLGS